MPELSRLEWARMNLDQVRSQLLTAATGGRFLTPEQLERAAGKIEEGLRIYEEETGPPPVESQTDGARPICSEPRRYRSR
ncbi:DUF6374 family protein [Nocardia concava]|uniref:DUF6374 family protein n=1 Tax=Nocardia concava TaxID=257281 RepID=UPI0012F7914A|nr:DUF6374 family protein [Nocardia concava]